MKIEESLFKAYVRVLGGENVAKKYRVELRLFSSELSTTLTHHGPVYSQDNRPLRANNNNEKAFIIDKKMFALFNNGFDHFGDHNMDENGEITVPIMVSIKKELDIPQRNGTVAVEATITLVD